MLQQAQRTTASRIRYWAAIVATLSLTAAAVADAQTNPPEAYSVKTGPSSEFALHYANSMCSVVSPPPGANWPPMAGTRTLHVGNVADIYTIYKPDVTHAATVYNVPITSTDRVLIYACGCVQTGGKGLTWKSYYDPKGADSDRYYSGTIGVLNSGQVLPPDFRNHPTGMRRLKDYIATQGSGFSAPPEHTATIVLGYQDSEGNYSDNGYYKHDDGNDGQCKGVGPAAVDVIIYHSGAR